MPTDRQFDLFSASGTPARPATIPVARPPVVAADLTDAELISAIPSATPSDCHRLAEEAGRRRLVTAVPALEALCRRFKGFGVHQSVKEQTAACDGLAAIGGAEAAAAVIRLITSDVMQGPGLSRAVAAAAALNARLPADTAKILLRHHDPAVRRDAARCAPAQHEVVAILMDLVHDLSQPVATAAACALARMGQTRIRYHLIRLLLEAPSPELIEAVVPIADEDSIVLLGRVARSRPELASDVLEALDDIDNDQAAKVAAAIRRQADQ